MKLQVIRLSDNGESTIGALYINGTFECWTLEDEKRTEKVRGETRIPNGVYSVGLRTEGGTYNRYATKRADIGNERGMLHIQDVPNFEYILIHIGNTDDDTAGCLLVGDTVNNNQTGDGFIGISTDAYKHLYPQVADALEKGEDVTIEYQDVFLI